MEKLDKLQEYINESTMILVINNNSKSLLDSLFNFLYNKYDSPKCKVVLTKKLMLKIAKIKNKLIRHESDLSRIQFSSTKNNNKIREDFLVLQSFISENNSKLLLKFDVREYKFSEEQTINTLQDSLYQMIPQYSIFNLVILIDKRDIKILKYQTDHKSFNMLSQYGDKESHIFDMTVLLRNTKLKKIKRLYEKES